MRDVFQQRHMLQLKGNVGIGHVRYPTAGCDAAAEAQPFYVNAPYGIGLAHNGNLTNARGARRGAVARRAAPPEHQLRLRGAAQHPRRASCSAAAPPHLDARGPVRRARQRCSAACRGGYAVVALIIGHGIVGFRDPHGIRPLVLGRRITARGTEWMLASE